MTQKLFKSTHVEIIQNGIHRKDNGDLVIPVEGFIFTNESDRDLEGDYFDIETDRGPLSKVLSYFDHQMSDYYIPEESNGVKLKGFGRSRVGVSEKVLTEEEREVWNIIIDHRHHYLNLIEELAKNNYLGASSVAFHREDDPMIEGRIKTWDTIAMDLTPTPAEPRAKVIVKNFLDHMIQEIDTEIINKEENMPTKLEENIKNAFKGVEEEKPEKPDAEEEVVEEVEDDQDTPEQEEVDDPTNEDIITAQGEEDIKALLMGFNERFDRMEENIEKSKNMSQDLTDAFPFFAEETAKFISERIREVGRQTIEEFEAESEVLKREKNRKKSKKPRHGESIYADKMNFRGR